MADIPTPLFPDASAASDRLRDLVRAPSLTIAPGVGDALGARLVEASGHETVFAGGFSIAAMSRGLPDTGLVGPDEILDQVEGIAAATSLPVIADADTGYGNAVNVQRTVTRFARAGAACVMIEDQQWPKRCGHTTGKRIVDRAEAVARIRAAVGARDAAGTDTLIMARTDAAGAVGFEEALWRCHAFAAAGADLTFLEAPEDETQMERFCREVPGPTVANMVEDGRTPWLTPTQLQDLGYAVALYPVSLLLHAADAQRRAAAALRSGESDGPRLDFEEVRATVGWPDYEDRGAGFADGEQDR